MLMVSLIILSTQSTFDDNDDDNDMHFFNDDDGDEDDVNDTTDDGNDDDCRSRSRGGRRRPVWLDKYGPPTRTEYRVIVENLSSRVSWQDLKVVYRVTSYIWPCISGTF